MISGYPDNTFQGNRSLTRYEFAALLNEASKNLTKTIAPERIASQDLTIIDRLIRRFGNELKALQSRVDN